MMRTGHWPVHSLPLNTAVGYTSEDGRIERNTAMLPERVGRIVRSWLGASD